MSRDIQKVLERWGAWVASDSCSVDYSPVAAGFKGLLPATRRHRASCCDDDGILISSAMNVLKKKDAYLCSLLEMYYIRQVPLRALGDRLGISRNLVAMRLQKGEGFIDGCICSLGISLEIDRECQLEQH